MPTPKRKGMNNYWYPVSRGFEFILYRKLGESSGVIELF